MSRDRPGPIFRHFLTTQTPRPFSLLPDSPLLQPSSPWNLHTHKDSQTLKRDLNELVPYGNIPGKIVVYPTPIPNTTPVIFVWSLLRLD